MIYASDGSGSVSVVACIDALAVADQAKELIESCMEPVNTACVDRLSFFLSREIL